jgi:hypothetical protein
VRASRVCVSAAGAGLVHNQAHTSSLGHPPGKMNGESPAHSAYTHEHTYTLERTLMHRLGCVRVHIGMFHYVPAGL